jgi:oligoribonuclease NrnB/cAMP/cGMP phosphodiesterase (DHH superfamily)
MKVILYHGNCFAGFGAAWVAWRRYKDEAVYIPCFYGAPLPPIPQADEADVIMVDYSQKRPEMEKLRSRVRSLVVLDHHATAEKELDGFPGATFNLNKSGAQLAWAYFFPLERTPLPLVDYIADRDLWRFEMPGSKEINAVVGATEFRFEAYEDLSNFLLLRPGNVIALGAAILQQNAIHIQRMTEHVQWATIAGYKEVPVVNASVLFSEVGNALLAEYPEAPFAAYYLDRADGKRQWGLRSRPDFDVSAVAKKLGGGGHPQAAGFVTDIPTIVLK